MASGDRAESKPSALSVLGADRFRRLSAAEAPQRPVFCDTGSGLRSLSALGQSLGSGINSGRILRASCSNGGLSAPPPASDPVTPNPRSAERAENGETGERPHQIRAAQPTNEPFSGFSALSLRLSSTRLQQRLTGEAAGGKYADAVKTDPHEATLSERGQALGEALGKKSKSGHPLVSAEGERVSDETEGFRRGRLAEWMELAVQHAPAPMRQQKAMPGGLQDAYRRAVRGYLTDCSLRTAQVERQADDEKEGLRNGTEDVLVLRVVQVYPGQEGALLAVQVVALPHSSDVATAAGLSVGAAARLLLHSRHPALLAPLDAGAPHNFSWPPPVGAHLCVRGFTVAGKAASPPGQGGFDRGPLLLPLGLTMAPEHELNHIIEAVTG